MRHLVVITAIGCALAGVVACGGTSSGPPEPPVGGSAPVIASLVAPRAGAEDLVVATVAGRPVWGSCMTAQAAAGEATTRAQALEQCIALELLAQAAEQRGLARDPAVVDATRTAMVNRLIATDFEAKHRGPADLGDQMDKVVDLNQHLMHRPDLRASSYVRVPVPANAPADDDARARVLAQAIADRLAPETGLMDAHLVAIAEEVAGAATLAHEAVRQTIRERLETPYADALFGIPEVGRIAGPVRTSRGWDVVLWSGGLPPKETSRAELAEQMFPDLRRQVFLAWVAQLVKERALQVQLVKENLAKLDEVGPS